MLTSGLTASIALEKVDYYKITFLPRKYLNSLLFETLVISCVDIIQALNDLLPFVRIMFSFSYSSNGLACPDNSFYTLHRQDRWNLERWSLLLPLQEELGNLLFRYFINPMPLLPLFSTICICVYVSRNYLSKPITRFLIFCSGRQSLGKLTMFRQD